MERWLYSNSVRDLSALSVWSRGRDHLFSCGLCSKIPVQKSSSRLAQEPQRQEAGLDLSLLAVLTTEQQQMHPVHSTSLASPVSHTASRTRVRLPPLPLSCSSSSNGTPPSSVQRTNCRTAPQRRAPHRPPAAQPGETRGREKLVRSTAQHAPPAPFLHPISDFPCMLLAGEGVRAGWRAVVLVARRACRSDSPYR